MGLATLIDVAKNGPARELNWFGYGGAIKGAANSFRLIVKLFSDQKVLYADASLQAMGGIISSTTGEKVQPYAYVDYRDNKLVGAEVINMTTSMYFLLPLPVGQVRNQPSIAGVIVHEFTHLLLGTRDYEYGCGKKSRKLSVGLNPAYSGQFYKSSANNADNYRCYFEDGYISYFFP